MENFKSGKIRQLHMEVFTVTIKVDLIDMVSKCLKHFFFVLLTSDDLNFRIGRPTENDDSGKP